MSRYLMLAESEDVVITRHGRPAGVLLGVVPRRTGSTAVLNIIPRRVAQARYDIAAGPGRWSKTPPVADGAVQPGGDGA